MNSKRTKEVRAKEPARICPAPREAPRRSRADVAPPATPSQAARRWKAGEAEDRKSGIYASDAPEEELVAVLASILELSQIKLRHSANQDFPVKFFRTDRDENNDLREVILNAILDDCRSTDQAIRLAVEWGDAKITRHQLQASLSQAPPPRASIPRPRLRPAPPPRASAAACSPTDALTRRRLRGLRLRAGEHQRPGRPARGARDGAPQRRLRSDQGAPRMRGCGRRVGARTAWDGPGRKAAGGLTGAEPLPAGAVRFQSGGEQGAPQSAGWPRCSQAAR